MIPSESGPRLLASLLLTSLPGSPSLFCGHIYPADPPQPEPQSSALPAQRMHGRVGEAAGRRDAGPTPEDTTYPDVYSPGYKHGRLPLPA